MTDAELTRLAAERVMGWAINPDGDMATALLLTRAEMNERHMLNLPWVCLMSGDHDCNQPKKHWNPLESIADAWMLVEAMQARGFWFFMNTADHWAGFGEGGSIKASSEVECKNATQAPRAITMAALRACGVAI